MKFLATQLVLGAALALTSSPTPWRGSPSHPAADDSASAYGSTTSVKVWFEAYDDDDDPDAPCLVEVQTLLDPALKSISRGSLLPRARAALQEEYGKDVVETVSPPHYVLVWVDGHWAMYCLGATSFEIDFGARGEVYVEIEDGLLMY